MLFVFLFLGVLFSEYDFKINTGVFYQTERNPLLRDTALLGADSYLISAGILSYYKTDKIDTKDAVDVSYLSYFSQAFMTDLSLVSLSASSDSEFYLTSIRKLSLSILYNKSADIIPVSGPFLQYRELDLRLKLQNTKSVWSLRPYFSLNIYDNDDDSFDRLMGGLGLAVVYKFLPETDLLFGIKYDWISHNNNYLNDARTYIAFLELDGRFTKKTTGKLSLSYVDLLYSDGLKFTEPNLELSFTSKFARGRFVKAGFFRKVLDSLYSDFYVDTGFLLLAQTTYMDSWIFKLNSEVVNRKYWNILRRDLVFDGDFAIYYPVASVPYFKNIYLMLKVSFSSKLTDAYNMALYGPDPAINYNNFGIIIGITNKI